MFCYEYIGTKNNLKFKIDLINDKKFLEALAVLITSKTEQIITLSNEQRII